jgi:Periplasmic binding protein domain
VTSNNKQAGELDGEYVADRLNGKGNVVIVNGPTGSAVTDRIAGFVEVIRKYPDIKILSQDKNGGGSIGGGTQVMANLLAAFPKIDAVFAINDSTAIGCDLAATQAQRKDLFIVGVDGTPDVVRFLRKSDSLIAASAAQNPYAIAEKAVEIGYEMMNGKKPEQSLTLIPVTLITRENIDSYTGLERPTVTPGPTTEASARPKKHERRHHEEASPYSTPETILPTFFPPTATSTVELQIIPALQNLTLQQASDKITEAMSDSGYEQRSYFWLDKEHGPGFAIVTHIEQIHPDGVPVSKERWSFDLPSYESFSIETFLKAMIKADPGNYRLIALVLSRVPFEEKKKPITQDQVAELNRGPKFLAQTEESSTVVTRDYHCIAYVYEFERKTRNDDPIFKDTSNVSASAHLASTPLWQNLTQLH